MESVSPPSAPRLRGITHVRASLSDDLVSYPPDAPRLQHSDYTIGWISALHIEMATARAMLDCIHKPLPMGAKDSNAYILGSIGPHNIVMACLPVAQYGTNNAANVASNMNRSFPSIRIRLMVGIGGGVPSEHADIRLGDVVVGCRIMQYDMGKVIRGGKTLPTGIPRITPPDHSTHVSSLRAVHEMLPSRIPVILQEMHRKYPGMTKYARPASPDRLFQSAYEHHPGAFDCSICPEDNLVPRPLRLKHDPVIHHGGIASGNQVMKHAESRDKIARAFDVICFEMEAAGLMDYFPCLVVRGICDYADSHKNKQWQEYAAAAAAAYAKELLEETAPFETVPYVSGVALQVGETDVPPKGQENFATRREELLESLRFDQIDSRQSSIETAHEETCSWFLEHSTYLEWLNAGGPSTPYGILWLAGKPGAGKSTLMKFLYTQLKRAQEASASAILSFFFNAGGEVLERSTTGMYRSLLLQLLKAFPDLQSVFDDFSLVPKDNHACPPICVVRKLFRNAVLLLNTRTLTCVIDALDESDEQQVRDMVNHFEDLGREAIKHSIQLRICFSSRHYPYISIQHALRLTLEDQKGHSQDMERYVKSRFKGSPNVFGDVQAQVLQKAAGVFMWVVLVVSILNAEFDRGRIFAVRKRLQELPVGLSDLFKSILRRDNENMQELLLCLQWILYAKRPLRPEEFYLALVSGSPDVSLSECNTTHLTSDILEKFVISSSKGLAEVAKSSHPTVQFIHESIRDFLLKDRGLLELWPDPSTNIQASSHNTLKECCGAYFNLCALDEPALERLFLGGRRAIFRKFPLLEYAVSHMLYHADMAAHEIPQHEFLSRLAVPHFITLSSLIVPEYDLLSASSDASLVYILAAEGLSNLIRALWPLPASQLDVPGGQFRYPLFAALIHNHRDAVRALLGWDASSTNEGELMTSMRFEVEYAINRSQTPLHWAVTNNWQSTVRQLLQMGAFIDARDRSGNTALLLSLFHGHEAIAELLIEAGANIHARDSDGQTALLIAVRFEHEDLVRILIDKGSDVDAKDYYGNTAWTMARRNVNMYILKLLIEAGADSGDDTE